MNDTVIRTEKITKTYVSGTNEVRALREVDLEVTRGELVAIMGASGSGKSTLMNLLGCLDTPTSGSYTLDGVRVDGLGRNELAAIRNQKLGFVFEDTKRELAYGDGEPMAKMGTWVDFSA